MSLYFLLPNYDKLQDLYVKKYIQSTQSYTGLLNSYNATKWLIPNARSNLIYNFNPMTHKSRYVAEYVPIGYWDNISHTWVWPWSSKYNKKYFETPVKNNDMMILKRYIGNISQQLVASDYLKLNPFNSAKIYQTIAALAMAAFNGQTVQVLRYPNGRIVYVVIKKYQEINRPLPAAVMKEMTHKRKSSKRRRKSSKRKRKSAKRKRKSSKRKRKSSKRKR